jgi:ACS family hexuronate transporter-like MFS transporter
VFGPIVGTSLASFALVRIAVAFDWQAAFFVAGIPGLILALLIWRFVDEPAPAPAPPAGADERPARGLLAHRNIVVCSLVSACAVGSIVVG